jgi:hypothetical protein
VGEIAAVLEMMPRSLLTLGVVLRRAVMRRQRATVRHFDWSGVCADLGTADREKTEGHLQFVPSDVFESVCLP